jgi:hypothetical protein
MYSHATTIPRLCNHWVVWWYFGKIMMLFVHINLHSQPYGEQCAKLAVKRYLCLNKYVTSFVSNALRTLDVKYQLSAWTGHKYESFIASYYVSSLDALQPELFGERRKTEPKYPPQIIIFLLSQIMHATILTQRLLLLLAVECQNIKWRYYPCEQSVVASMCCLMF